MKIPNEKLRQLCIRESWFTDGSFSQYNKLFDANSNGASVEILAAIIWVCSETDMSGWDYIIDKLKEAQLCNMTP